MEAMQQIVVVAGVLALLGATLWWLRRRGFALPAVARRGAAKRLEAVERVALGPQQTLHLLRLGERALLVASSPAGCALIDKFTWNEIARPEEMVR